MGLALAAAALVCSCAKEELKPQESSVGGKYIVKATVSLPDPDDTKVSYAENDSDNMDAGIKGAWAEGDTFYALQDGTTPVKFTLSNMITDRLAEFTAETGTEATPSTTWTAVLGKNVEVSGSKLICGYEGQNGTLADFDNFDYILCNATGENPTVSFKSTAQGGTGDRLSYFMRIKLPAGIQHIEYCTTTHWEISGYSTETASGHNAAVMGKNDGHFNNVSMINLAEPSTEGQVVYLAIPAKQHAYYNSMAEEGRESPKGIIITFFNADSSKSNGKVISSNLETKGGKIGTFDVTGMTLIHRPDPSTAISFGSTYVEIKKQTTSAYDNYNNFKDYKSPTVVTVKWAPYNLGANVTDPGSKDDIYGEYFCWGETAPRTTFDEYVYDGTHALNLEQIGDMQWKTANDGLHTDRVRWQRIGGTKYDAARVRWGSAWRMPTVEEFCSLTGDNDEGYNSDKNSAGLKTNYKDTTVNGVTVNGRYFKKGDAILYFPLGGSHSNSSGRSNEGQYGYYWTDSRLRRTPDYPSLLNSPIRFKVWQYRIHYDAATASNGLLIRPVVNDLRTVKADVDITPVTEDAYNVYGKVTNSSTGAGIPGIIISDGYYCIRTDNNGEYKMAAYELARTISVSVPAEYEIPLDSNGAPAFFQRIDLAGTTPVQANFSLTPRASVPERVTVIAMADAHVSSTDLSKFQTSLNDIQATANTLKNTGIPVGIPANAPAGEVIGIAIGDQLNGDMTQASAVKTKFNSLNFPVFYTIGNHDYDPAGATDYEQEANFVNNFCPTNYSFTIGNVHFVVMDDIIYNPLSGTCSYGFTPEQAAWINLDALSVPNASDKIAVLCVHAPLNTLLGNDINDAVASALKNRFKAVHVLSGHTHSLKNDLYVGWEAKNGRSIYEHTLQSLSGYWWLADITTPSGSPAGYGVFTFDQNDIYAEYNKTTKEDAGFQMRIYKGTNSSWNPLVKNKAIIRIWDAGDAEDIQDTWTVTKTDTNTRLSRVSTEIVDYEVRDYVQNVLGDQFGTAHIPTDQFWYTSESAPVTIRVKAVHKMKSGWEATYIRESYMVNTNGFGYGVRY